MSLRLCPRFTHWPAHCALSSRSVQWMWASPTVLFPSLSQRAWKSSNPSQACVNCAGNPTIDPTGPCEPMTGLIPARTKDFHFTNPRRAHKDTFPAFTVTLSPVSHIHTPCQSLLPHQQRGYNTAPQSSSLYSVGSIDGPQAPVRIDLDLERRLSGESVDQLRQNLSARGLNIDVGQLLKDYAGWKELDKIKEQLEAEKVLIAKTMSSIVKGKKSENKREKEELIQKGKAVKQQLRDVMQKWWAAEEKVVLQALKLPTDLHPRTPAEDKELERWDGQVDVASGSDHVQYAQQIGLIKFSNVGPRAVYLFGELAELEQSLLHLTAGKMEQHRFSPIACPEIFRSIVVEGCGLDQTNPDEVLSLHQKEEDQPGMNAYHLKGNSLLSYTAFFTKTQLRRDRLPMRMYSIGRHYRPQTGEDLPGLYGTVQSNRVTMFAACDGSDQSIGVHQDMVAVTWNAVQGLGLPARKVQVSAGNLAPSESLRTEIQVWAPGPLQYVTVGYASIHNDYPSCRLMSRTPVAGQYLHMVSGVAMDTTVALASILEHSISAEVVGTKASNVDDVHQGYFFAVREDSDQILKLLSGVTPAHVKLTSTSAIYSKFHDGLADILCQGRQLYDVIVSNSPLSTTMQNDVDDCSPNPCLHGGTCQDGVNSYTCACLPGYTGDQCQTDIDDCLSQPCLNGATCRYGLHQYTCTCPPGFIGDQCQTDMDDCFSHPCLHGGTCQDGVNSYSCTCPPGYTGDLCRTDIDDCASSVRCHHGGTCIDGVNSYSCACVPGVTGSQCEINLDDCDPNPCHHGGTCWDGISSYLCVCAPGYTGHTCQTDIDDCSPNPCHHGGTCRDGVNYTCTCPAGYTGDHCQTDIDDCLSQPCFNGGTCQDGVNSYTCRCPPGLTGDQCQTVIDDCNPNPCLHGGTCFDGVHSYLCTCPSGYTGVRCQTDIDDCSSHSCFNGGTCVDGVNSFTCTCRSGFTGVQCQTDIDDCSPNPCLHGGTCNDRVNSYTCTCPAGNTGHLCQTVYHEPTPCVDSSSVAQCVRMCSEHTVFTFVCRQSCGSCHG